MRVCILTPGQPSNNPRVVKEADALTEAGYSVHAVCSDCGLWPSQMDRELMQTKRWTMEYAGGTAARQPLYFKFMRARHGLSRRILKSKRQSAILQRWAIGRAVPELEAAALRNKADLYIAHHPSVLPSAILAANHHGAKAGYDVEDFYAGMYPANSEPSQVDRLIEQIEAECLPACSYVTAASPGFADIYASKYGIAKPTSILNVFPLADQPQEFQPTGLSDRPVRLYWFSQVLGGGRGLEDVIHALGLLKDCRFELHLRGNWLTGYKKALFECALQAGMSSESIFTYPPAPPSEMVRLAAPFDVGLCVEQPADHSRPFGITNKTFVSLLAGNAIASTNMPGQKPLLEVIGDAAFSYSPGNFHELAAGLKRWHDDRNKLDAARRRAWDWGRQRYNWDVEKYAFLAMVNSVLNPSELRQHCA